MSVFSDRLQEAMCIRGLRQTDLCHETGIGKSSMSFYLSGGHEPKRANLHKIAKCLGVDPDWLCGQDDNSPTAEEMANSALDREFLECLQRISIPQKKALLAYVKTLADPPGL